MSTIAHPILFFWALWLTSIINKTGTKVLKNHQKEPGNIKNDYTNLEKRGQNISMEDTSGLGINNF